MKTSTLIRDLKTTTSAAIIGIFLALTPFSAKAAVQGFSIPVQNFQKVSVTNPGNLPFRLDVVNPMAAGGYNCKMFYLETNDNNLSQKFQVMLSAYLQGKPLQVTVDFFSSYSSAFCHIIEIAF
jgi:hypothetical protein